MKLNPYTVKDTFQILDEDGEWFDDFAGGEVLYRISGTMIFIPKNTSIHRPDSEDGYRLNQDTINDYLEKGEF